MADDVNLYSYVGNSPVMKVDLLGLFGTVDGICKYDKFNNSVLQAPGKYIVARSYSNNELSKYKDNKGNVDYKRFDRESNYARAARTRYNELIKQGILPENIILERIDCVKSLEDAWKRREQLDNIMGMNIFSHGTLSGPEVAGGSGKFWDNGPSQLNWDENAEVVFHGCNTAEGVNKFSKAQGVTTYGQNFGSTFSSSKVSKNIFTKYGFTIRFDFSSLIPIKFERTTYLFDFGEISTKPRTISDYRNSLFLSNTDGLGEKFEGNN